jgi:predicted dehydrogenase
MAGEISRKKGRVVVLGGVGMNLPREPYYLKELELRLSTSYGPGRYDPEYEERGQDYPYGYVRWTEQRNMEAFLWLIKEGKVDVKTLTTHRFEIGDAEAAYRMMMEGNEPYVGIMLSYPEASASPSRPAAEFREDSRSGDVRLGLIGAGNHVRDMLIPHLVKAKNVRLNWVCTGTGINADALAEKLGVAGRTTDYQDVLQDETTNAVLIGTRHDSHARIVREAMDAGKHVFVEKPLCLTEEELDELQATYAERAPLGQRLMVGFNRRFSEHGVQARGFFEGHREPLVMCYRINAGAIPADHWAQNPESGGGRIIGEACHFLDFMQFVCDALPVSVRGMSIGTHSSGITSDQCILTFTFADGSVGSIVYASGGDPALPKERFEAFGCGKALTMDDFLTTHFFENGGARRFKSGKRDKGFAAEMRSFCHEVMGGGPPSMSFVEIVAISRGCILADRSLQTGEDYDI